MTTPRDVAPATDALTFSGASASASKRRDESDAASLAQEINERRARVENAELLRNLRSL